MCSQAREMAEVINPDGDHAVVLVCEHASSYIPDEFNRLGLADDVAASHIAWDPGADEIALEMSRLLNAPLVRSCVSRLVYDCNRPPEAIDAAPAKSEIHEVPGNRDLDLASRMARARQYYTPFKSLLSATLRKHPVRPVLVTIHTFTPVYFGKRREVEIGILHDADSRLADEILAVARSYVIRRNEPYGPRDGVTHTLREHGLANGYLNVMIEVRNDLAATLDQCKLVARDLAEWIEQALVSLDGGNTGREAFA